MARALVIGLAETGVAVGRRLRGEGWDVTVLEDAPSGAHRYAERVAVMRDIGADLVEAPDDPTTRKLASSADLVVPSPLVRLSHPAITAAAEAHVPVRSEIDLAAERASMPLIAVTGTNGKTTVTTLAVAMLESSGVHALAAGNIGRPLIDAVSEPADVIVAEVSSFQLAFSESFRPRVAVMLAITPDHLDWHGSFAHYLASKARITARQHADDLFVYDADDANATEVAASSAARTIGISVREASEALTLPDGRVLAKVRDMRRALMHDRTNALAAGAAALDVGATPDGVRVALATYATMRHRVELVGEANGVQWYDDSKATNPDATVRAVSSFDSVVLLAGGRNKGLDLSVLASLAPRLRAVIGFGEAGPEVAGAFTGVAGPSIEAVETVGQAVAAARAVAQPGDVVLLSPACASFDAYDGYAQRGDDFAAHVRAFAGAES